MERRVGILVLVSMLPLCGPAQQAGVPTEWDVQKLVEGIAAQSSRILPLIEQIRAKEWVTRGASETYVQQWDAAHSQAASLKLASANLVREPARLSAALDVFFRMQNLEDVLTSLIDGVRKHQNPALADLLRSVLSENSASRQQLRQYLTDLAAAKELEAKVMD